MALSKIVTTSNITDIIHPSNKHNKTKEIYTLEQQKLSLHGIDAIIPPFAFSMLLFFSPPPPSSNTYTINDIIDKLKNSLAEALELYPPLAGAVHCDDNDNYHIDLDPLNGRGTPFHFEIKNKPYINSGNDGNKGLLARNEEESSIPLTSESSVLAIKLTQYSCGTIAMAISVNHQVSDLHSLLDFVQVWALIARDEPIDYSRIPNDWARSPSRFFPFYDKKFTVPPAWSVHPHPVPIEKVLEHAYVPGKATVWSITRNSIHQLKTDILSSSSFKNSNKSGFPCNSLWISKSDALTALLSGALTRSRESNTNIKRPWGRSDPGSKVEKINISCNCRSRAPQGMIQSHNYFGNLVKMTESAILREDLLSPTIDATGGVALTIRTALNQELTPHTIANYLAFFDPKEMVKPLARLQLNWDILFSNWCQFDLTNAGLDFGWGKPFKGCPDSNDSTPGVCIVMNGEVPGDILISLGVELSCVEKLKADPLLTKYATLVAS
ncbi:transferase [Phascolomyces articulosus]|uniref:Transferase n=1 Tax=Phascolomyces articulosus TaxID=60185 RepID=A0AAD5KV95_9FUNG|nr:transferase [Phascolomyces articulosus]